MKENLTYILEELETYNPNEVLTVGKLIEIINEAMNSRELDERAIEDSMDFPY